MTKKNHEIFWARKRTPLGESWIRHCGVQTSQSARYCRTVVRATHVVNRKPRFLHPQGSKTPEPMDIKLDRDDYVWDLTPHANFGISIPKGGGAAYA